jgi:hypothetical protein
MAALIELRLSVRGVCVVVRASVNRSDPSQDITIPYVAIDSIRLAEADANLIPLLTGTTLADIEHAMRQWAQVRERLEHLPEPVPAESVPF